MTSLSLSAYAIGLPAFIAVKVLAPGFYARQDTRTPVKIAITAMVANMILNLAFVAALLAVDFNGTHMGLALATSTAAYINAGLLYVMLRRQRTYRPEQGWGRLLISVAIGCLAMGLVISWMCGEVLAWSSSTASTRAARLAQIIAVGMVVFVAVSIVAGLRKRDVIANLPER